jgi:hypothetical protein
MVSTLHPLTAPDPKTFLYQTSDKPFGILYKEWTERWWQWFVGIPHDKHPAKDPSGGFAHTDQTHAEVFFLAGAVNRRAKRTPDKIPKNKALLFPVLCVENSFLEWPGSTLGDLQKLSQSYADDMISLEAIIDHGTTEELVLWTGELSKYRIYTDVFELKFTPKNLFVHQGGTTKATADGYWCFIRENFLDPGQHTIWFHGVGEYYQTEVTYFLNIT